MWKWLALAGLSAAIVLAGLGWRVYGNAEEKIKATIITGAKAVQQKEFSAAIRCISPRYRDDSGFTFRDIQRGLFDWCRSKQSQAWLTVQPLVVYKLNFWQALTFVQVKGIIAPEGLTAVNFGPLQLTIELERTWWGQWRITAMNGWQNDPNLQRLQGELTGEM